MIFTIVIKNIKIILRSPFTIILLVLAPIFLMFIVGFTYSGTVFTQTQVGVIDYDGDAFNKLSNMIDFRKYLGENSGKNCRDDLKRGDLELCILYEESKNSEGMLTGASIIYYIDNTRPQVSSLLINNFDLVIDKKTKDISTKTITDIFSEMNDAIIFMNDSKNLIDDVQEDLNSLKRGVSQIKIIVIQANKQINENYDILVNLRKDLKNNFDIIKESNSNYINSLDDISEQLDDLYEITRNANSQLNDIKQNLVNYGNINPDIYNYITINDITSISTSFNTISNKIYNSRNLIDSMTIQMKNQEFDIFDKTLNGFDNLLNIFSENKKSISDLEKEIISFENIINQREAKLNEIEIKMDEKIDYFNQISNLNAANIAEPISKKNEPIFKNFKRVHQLAPNVVVLVLLFVGLLLSNILVSLEINSKAYFRNLISPISQFQFVFGLFITSFILIGFQLFFLFLVLVFYFSIPVFQNFMQLGIVIFHLTIIFILIGIFLAYFFSSVQISILVTTFVMLFMFLLSDLIVPIEIMPSIMAKIISLNPTVLGGDLIRKIFYYSDIYNLNFISLIPFYITIFILILLIWYASFRRKRISF